MGTSGKGYRYKLAVPPSLNEGRRGVLGGSMRWHAWRLVPNELAESGREMGDVVMSVGETRVGWSMMWQA